MGQPVEPRARQTGSEPKISVHSLKGRFEVTRVEACSSRWEKISNSRSALVFRQRDVAELVHDQYILRDERRLHAQQALVIPGLEQVVHHRGGGGEAHPRAFLPGRQPQRQRQRQMRLARAGVAQRQHVLSPVEIR